MMSKARTARWGAAGVALSLLGLGIGSRRAPAQNAANPTAPPAGRIRQLLTVGDPVRGQDRAFGIAFFNQDPVQPGLGVSLLHQVTDDGSLFVSDYAGVSLFRFRGTGAHTAAAASSGSGVPEVLLDSSHPDPVDGVALARIVTVETSRRGVSAILALRADGVYGLYRLDKGTLTRLALYPSAIVRPDLPFFGQSFAISDAGQIAYAAPNARGENTLFQTTPAGVPIELMRAGESVSGGVVVGFKEVSSNGAGDLTFSVLLRGLNGLVEAIFRKWADAVEQVVAEGDIIEMTRGTGRTGPLKYTVDPRIGPDGTVVFTGMFPPGEDQRYLINLFAQRPGQPVEPLFDHSVLLLPFGSPYAVDAGGAVAVVVLDSSAIYLAPPGGGAELIIDGRQKNIGPIGGLTFDTGGDLFFLAFNKDLPRDRYGVFAVRLYRYQRRTGAVREVEVGRSLPANPGLLSLFQPPVLSPGRVTVGAAFGGSDRFTVPMGGLFQLTPDSPSGDQGTLVAAEGEALPDAGRVGIPRSLYYTHDGSLVADVVLPGGGTAAITLRTPAGTASRARTQAASASPLVPLMATGQSLGQPDRTLLSFLGEFVPLGVDQQLVTARYSQAGETGEGLFAVSRTHGVQLLADTLHGTANSRLTSFSEALQPLPGLPSVSPDGNVAFGAFEDRGSPFPRLSVFQWLRSSGSVVKMFSSYDDPIGLTATRWQAGPAGTVYVRVPTAPIETQAPAAPGLYRCSLRPGTQAAQAEPLVIDGKTPVAGSPTALQQVLDFVVDGSGEIFLSGKAGVSGQPATMKSGVFRWDLGIGRLEPAIMEGDSLPPFADGRKVTGLVFNQSFSLLRDSARGPLLFRAGTSAGDGLFRRDAQGRLETLFVERLGVAGARNLSVVLLPAGVGEEERQTANGHTVFSVFDVFDGHLRWKIIRTQLVRDAGGQPVRDAQGNPRFETTVVVQEGEPLGDGRRLASLNAQRLVPAYREGPIFTVNDAGDVAFFASDGQRWGVYEFSDRP